MNELDISGAKIYSNYICSCGNLIYGHAETGREFCLNNKCKHYINETIRDNPENVNKEMARAEKQLMLQLGRFDTDKFIEYIVVRREKILKGFLKEGKSTENTLTFQTLNEVLLRLVKVRFKGRERSPRAFNAFINKYAEDIVKRLNIIDDISTKRIILTQNDRPIELKYYPVFWEIYNNYGISKNEGKDMDKCFFYSTIDHKRKIGVEQFPMGGDLRSYYQKFYRLMVQIKYTLFFFHRTSLLFKYPFDKRDLAFLLSIFYSLDKGDLVTWANKMMNSHLWKNHQNKNRNKEFLSNIDGTKGFIPISFNLNNNYFLGKHSILFFVFHAFAIYDAKMLEEGKQIASQSFEQEIRDRINKIDYKVPRDEEVTLTKKSPSYDAIGISHKKKEVVVIEAKYKDPSPSSLSGTKLLDQELYGKGAKKEDALIPTAKHHEERINYFNKNIKSFEKHLGEQFKGYKIRPIVVTKYTPLINKYNNIEIIRFADLEACLA